MESLLLDDSQDLGKLLDTQDDINTQWGWAGQNVAQEYLVHLALSQLGKSRYKKQIEALNISNAASGSSFSSIEEFKQGLFRLDITHGLLYGGAATKSPTAVITPLSGSHPKYKP